jgi:hypothetical protein
MNETKTKKSKERIGFPTKLLRNETPTPYTEPTWKFAGPH